MIISPIVVQKSTEYSLEDWIENPPEKKEWVDGKLSGLTQRY